MVRTARQAGSQQQLRQSLAESSGLRGILPWKHAMLHLQKQKQELLDRAFNAVLSLLAAGLGCAQGSAGR